MLIDLAKGTISSDLLRMAYIFVKLGLNNAMSGSFEREPSGAHLGIY